MLWQKSWWETRWGLLILMGTVLLFAFWRQPWEQADLTVMSGETSFRYGRIPWLGLLASFGASTLMMISAVRIYERRDF